MSVAGCNIDICQGVMLTHMALPTSVHHDFHPRCMLCRHDC